MQLARGTRSAGRWWRIMPILFVTYSFAYLDRVNYSFASAGGISRDLGVSASTASLIAALFFLGYFCAQIPGAMYAEKRSAKKLVFWCLVLWGILSSLTGVVSNVPSLMAVRFLLGVVEAAVFPALLVFINHWFLRSERSLANTFVVLSSPVTIIWMSIVSGYLVNSFGWRAMFVIEGIPATLWGFIWWIAVEDRPSQASWLSHDEREDLEARMAAEQRNIKPVRNYGEAFRSPLVIRFAVLYFFWGIGLFGFIFWLPSILRQAGSTMIQTGWLSGAPYVLTSVAMLCVSVASDRTGVRKPFVWPFLLMSGIAFVLLFAAGALPFWASYALMAAAGVGVFASMPTFWAILPEYLPKHVAGSAAALVNSFGALGGFAGSYLVGLASLSGKSATSFLLMGLSLLLSAILFVTSKEARLAE
jgi:sugar phosphate permease